MLACATVGSAFAQGTPLTIGDKAPEFKPAGWAKGAPVPAFKKGNVYIVEFWATWCGPCIASMPHLSEMADSFKGKATFISVNTWDYNANGGKEEPAAHEKRVKDWIKQNDSKMRYTIALDDAKDTIANTWMRAAGRNGIPCAFVVDQEGRIAWIGHPMDKMEDVVADVHAKKWDIAAYKAKFQEGQKKEIEAAAKRKEAQAKVNEAVAKKDLKMLEATFEAVGSMNAISMACGQDPEFGMQVLEAYAGKDKSVPAYVWCNIAGVVAQKSTVAETKAKAVKLSEECFKAVPDKEAAVGAIYHARVLYNAGNKADAIKWADKAMELVAKFEPATSHDSLKKFITDQKASFK